MKKIFFITASFIAIAIISCTKHKDDIEDSTPKATIQFMSPSAGAVYNSGDSVSIVATAISTATVHGYDVIIRRADDTAKLYFKHVHDHNDTLQINRKWKADISNAALEAEIILYLDHDGHLATKKARFRVQ